MIACRTLGPVEVSVDGAVPPRALTWAKHLALVIYLARSPKRARTREHLIGLLWSEKPEGLARQSLNEAVHILRKCAGDGGVESDATQVRIAPSAVTLDTDTFEALVGAGDDRAAVDLVKGEFLEGFSIEGASEFDNWLGAEREHWRRRSVDVQGRYAERLLASGQVGAALDVLQLARSLDWRRETSLRTMLRALALVRDRAGALAVFEQFAARLKTELDAQPDAETAALADRIRREKAWRFRESADASMPPDYGWRRAPLIGRARELERLVDIWSTTRVKRKATVAVIEGDAGAGKTRLAEELAVRARLDGAVVAALRAVEADRGDPWSGVRGITRGGLLDAPGVVGAPPAALAQLREETGADAPGRALTQVLLAVAEEQPVLVLVDDAYWLDRESLLALGAVVRDVTGAPIGFVITTTPDATSPELDALRARIGGDVAGTVVKLGVFGGDSVRELARWALPSYRPEQLDRLTRWVLADSAGIPLLVVALLHAVVAGLELGDARLVLGDASVVQGDSEAVWPLPTQTFSQTLPGQLADNVVAAIRINFRRLSRDAQLVLVAAAVLGARVDSAMLERATGVLGTALGGALDELEWQGWLVVEPRGYAFVARIVRDVIDRDMVTEGQRRRIRDAAGGAS
jgi:serine/threonine-protein kinase